QPDTPTLHAALPLYPAPRRATGPAPAGPPGARGGSSDRGVSSAKDPSWSVSTNSPSAATSGQHTGQHPSKNKLKRPEFIQNNRRDRKSTRLNSSHVK